MLLKKISAKTMIGNVKKLASEHENGTVIDLLNAYGKARGIKTGNSTYGDWVSFVGDFEAVDLRTGEVSQAPQIFLVEPLQSMLVNQLRTHDLVEFAYKLSIVCNDEILAGYEYRVSPLLEVQRSDELSHLRELAGVPNRVTNRLEAPTQEININAVYGKFGQSDTNPITSDDSDVKPASKPKKK